MQIRNANWKYTPEIQNEMRRVAGGDMRMTKTCWVECLRWGMLLGVTAWSAIGAAQEPANRTQPPSPESMHEPVSDSVRELREQVGELQAAVAEMHSDWQRARAETAGLRNVVLSNAVAKVETGNSGAAAGSLQSGIPQGQRTESQKEAQKKAERTASLDEEYQLLSGKVDDQYQTKVESASK